LYILLSEKNVHAVCYIYTTKIKNTGFVELNFTLKTRKSAIARFVVSACLHTKSSWTRILKFMAAWCQKTVDGDIRENGWHKNCPKALTNWNRWILGSIFAAALKIWNDDELWCCNH